MTVSTTTRDSGRHVVGGVSSLEPPQYSSGVAAELHVLPTLRGWG